MAHVIGNSFVCRAAVDCRHREAEAQAVAAVGRCKRFRLGGSHAARSGEPNHGRLDGAAHALVAQPISRHGAGIIHAAKQWRTVNDAGRRNPAFQGGNGEWCITVAVAQRPPSKIL